MNPLISKAEVLALIQQSGFPLELRITKTLVRLGYEVSPSHLFYDRSRDKDTELDIVATRNKTFTTQSGKSIVGILRIGIECKSNTLPYVCLGLPHSTSVDPGIVDGDGLACHFLTSRDDGFRNRFAFPLFGSDGDVGFLPKQNHHHFAGDVRFHFLGGVDPKGKAEFKFHETDALGLAQSKLGAFVGNFHRYGEKPEFVLDRTSEQMGVMKGPVVVACFTLLVHSGIHYRFTLDNSELVDHNHTPIFLNRTYLDQSINYVVDLVQEDHLPAALRIVSESFDWIVGRLSPWLFASK